MDETRPDEVISEQESVSANETPVPSGNISKPNKTAVKAYQKQARAEGAQYLKEKKSLFRHCRSQSVSHKMEAAQKRV